MIAYHRNGFNMNAKHRSVGLVASAMAFSIFL